MSPTDQSGPRGKLTARRAALLQRDALPHPDRETASLEIARLAHALLVGGSSRTVAVYAAKGSEVDPRELAALLVRGGCRVVYPRVVDGARVLAFHEANEADLVVGYLGLREPPATAPAVDVTEIDAFVVPGLAFDRTGGRLGWGRGHYDATLACAPDALRVGLAFECQLMTSVPVDVHDVRLHAVVTERAVYRMTS